MTLRALFHNLRVIASFALLGAVVTGTTLGWIDNAVVDVRAVGAAAGGFGAFAVQIANFLK